MKRLNILEGSSNVNRLRRKGEPYNSDRNRWKTADHEKRRWKKGARGLLRKAKSSEDLPEKEHYKDLFKQANKTKRSWGNMKDRHERYRKKISVSEGSRSARRLARIGIKKFIQSKGEEGGETTSEKYKNADSSERYHRRRFRQILRSKQNKPAWSYEEGRGGLIPVLDKEKKNLKAYHDKMQLRAYNRRKKLERDRKPVSEAGIQRLGRQETSVKKAEKAKRKGEDRLAWYRDEKFPGRARQHLYKMSKSISRGGLGRYSSGPPTERDKNSRISKTHKLYLRKYERDRSK